MPSGFCVNQPVAPAWVHLNGLAQKHGESGILPSCVRAGLGRGDDTSPEQEEKGNYDESKTDGNIQKPWQCEHSIAVYPHLQMEIYRLIAPCVLSKVRGVGT